MNKKNILLIVIVFFLKCTFVFSNEISYRSVYIGIASSGQGSGIFGHSFLIFTRGKRSLSRGMAYAFTMRLSETDSSSNMKIKVPAYFTRSKFQRYKSMALSYYIGYMHTYTNLKDQVTQMSSLMESSPMIVETKEALEYVKRYLYEDRPVYLYKIKLTKKQIRKLKSNLDEEKEVRDKLTSFDYSLITNNCLTNIIKHLNLVLDPEMRILESKKDNYIPEEIRPKNILFKIPAFTSLVLLKSKAIEQIPIVWQPIIYYEIKAIMKSNEILVKLSSICSWTEKRRKAIETINSLEETRSTESFINFLYSKSNTDCKSSEEGDIYFRKYLKHLLQNLHNTNKFIEFIHSKFPD